MIEIGKHNTLEILRYTSAGLFLGDESGQDVLLPHKYCPENYTIGDEIEVFIYTDSEDRIIATNITPKISFNDFALLQVTDMTEVGAFMDWGLEKDLLVPFREQRLRMEKDRWYIVYLDLDKKTDRLYATNKIEKLLSNETLTVNEGEEVDLMILKKTDLGFSVIVNKKHKGLIYNNEIFTTLNIGDKLKGFVKKIRENNKLDISLQPIGYTKFSDKNSQLIYQALQENEGFIGLNDKSSPEDIYDQLGISKKAFKKAIGAMYKARKIVFVPGGVKLVEDMKKDKH